MMMISGSLHTCHGYSASTWVGWFGCRVLLSSTHKIIFSAPTKILLKFSVRLHSSGRLDSKWACREVFVQSELVWLAHFISVITNMRHKEKILRSSNFLPPHETQIFLLLSDKYDKTSWMCWPDPIFKILLNKKIRYFACGLGCGPTSVRVCPRVHACRVNQVRL